MPKLSVTTPGTILAAIPEGDQLKLIIANQPFYSYGKWIDGAHNKFLGTSVLWYVDPIASISEMTQQNAKIVPSSEGVYTVFYSGTGELTNNIRQYVWAETKIFPEEIQKEEKKPEPVVDYCALGARGVRRVCAGSPYNP